MAAVASEIPSPTGRSSTCPRCGYPLGPPVSGDVHCYVECTQCRSRFELDDPELG